MLIWTFSVSSKIKLWNRTWSLLNVTENILKRLFKTSGSTDMLLLRPIIFVLPLLV